MNLNSKFKIRNSKFFAMHFVFALLFLPLSFFAQAQEMDVYVQPFDPFAFTPDTTEVHTQIIFHTPSETVITTDTVIWASDGLPEEIVVAETTAFRPNPERVLWLGAIIPGFGQIANRQYWKLPFVYGGFMGCAFAISWFSNEYNFFRIAHRDILDPDITRRSYMDWLDARGITIEQMGGRDQYTRMLQSARDNNRRFRDWAILISILYYGAVVLEAYVTAHLFDFDISPDLSLNIQPAIMNSDFSPPILINEYDIFAQQTRMPGNTNTFFGFQWSIRF